MRSVEREPGLDGYLRWPITVERFAKMIEAGVFAPGERVDLVEGRILSYAPPHEPPHAGTVFALSELVSARLGDRVDVWSQLPLVLGRETQVEPDLTLVAPRAGGYRKAHPTVAEVRAVIEVSYATLRRDGIVKRRLYAKVMIPEYWIVDVTGEAVEVCREPLGQGYGSVRRAVRGETVSFLAFPDVSFSVDEIFG